MTIASCVPLSTATTNNSGVSRWTWHRLTDLARLESGHTPSRSRPDWWGGDIPWIALPDIRAVDGQVITRTIETTNAEGIAHSAARILPTDTVVMSRTASVGFVARMGRRMATSQDFVNWVCGPDLDPEFLMHLLIRSRDYVRSLSSGAVHKTVYFPTVKAFRVCVPDIDEQRRIAAQLTDQLAAVDQLAKRAEAMRAETTSMSGAVRASLFAGLAGPQERLVDAIVEPGAIIDGPFGSNLKSDHYQTEGVRVIRLGNIGVGEFIDVDRAYVTEDHFISLARHAAAPGDIVVAALGDGARPAGRACLVPSELKASMVKADCFRIRPNSRLFGPYLMEYLNSPQVLETVASSSRGATRPRMTLGILKSLEVPVPSMSEQRYLAAQLADRLATIDTMTKSIKAELEAIEALPAALLRRAFGSAQ